MKKLIALILCVSMLTGMLPAASLADTLLYEYPQVNAYLLSNDREALEYEFRQWAAKAVGAYILNVKTSIEESDYYSSLGLIGFKGISSVIEYYRMADTKIKFDRDEGKFEENIYNNYEMNDSEMQGMYLWVFLESIKEKMYANNFAVLEQYGNIKKNEKRYWMLDVETGELKKDSLAQQAQNASDDVTNSKWAKVASNFVTALLETVGNYLVITNGANSDWGDLINGIGESLNSGIKMAIDANKTNALIEVDNAVRDELQKDLSEAVNNVSDAMLAYLKESYINTENEFLDRNLYGAKYYTNLIKNFIDNVEANRDEYQADLDQEVKNSLAEESAKEIINSINYDVLETLDASQITAMAFISGIQTAFEEALNYGFGKLKEKLSGRFELPLGTINISIQWSDVLDAFTSVAVSQGKKGVEEYLAEIQRKARNGEELPENMGVEAIDRAWSKISSTESWEDIKAKLIAICIASPVAGKLTKELQDGDAVVEELVNFIETYFQILAENGIKGENMDEKDAKKMITGMLKYVKTVSDDDLKGINSLLKEKQEIPIEMMRAYEHGDYYSPNVDRYDVMEGLRERYEELDQMEEKLNEKAQQLRDNIKAFDIVLKVADSWWEVGTSIQAALESSASASSGEGIMSMLGMRMVSCQNMSAAIRDNLAATYLPKYAALYNSGATRLEEAIINPEIAPLDELYSIISQLYITNQYDVVGSSAYLDMVLHEDIFYKDWNLFSAKFARYISDYHINNQGNKGLLPYDAAVNEYKKRKDDKPYE